MHRKILFLFIALVPLHTLSMDTTASDTQEELPVYFNMSGQTDITVFVKPTTSLLDTLDKLLQEHQCYTTIHLAMFEGKVIPRKFWSLFTLINKDNRTYMFASRQIAKEAVGDPIAFENIITYRNPIYLQVQKKDPQKNS